MFLRRAWDAWVLVGTGPGRGLPGALTEVFSGGQALLLQGAGLVLQRHRRSRDISAGMDFVMSHDAELLTRLGDA
jgi:hypothetical protein